MRLGMIGFGSIGRSLAEMLGEEPVCQFTLLVRPGRAEEADHQLADLAPGLACRVVTDLTELISARPELVVECAGQPALDAMAATLLQSGIDLVPASVGALADPDLAERLEAAAELGGAQIFLPAGAVGGIDLLAALAPAGGLSVTYRGSKPPAAWAGSPATEGCNLNALVSPKIIFAGSAREAARRFPKNANVAAIIALAGAGLDDTHVELIADPNAIANRHSFRADSPLGRFEVSIENQPSAANPRTSQATAMSLMRAVRNRRARIAI
ncbi:MAG: aspartate dehydrogenase [Pseudomonadota bacterium]